MCEVAYHINQAFNHWRNLHSTLINQAIELSPICQYMRWSMETAIDYHLSSSSFFNNFLQKK